MAGVNRSSFSHMFTGFVLTSAILAEFLLAVPLMQPSTEHGSEPSSSKRLIRSRRNISWYKQHSDFWNWYKFFTDSGNQQGVAELDRMYLAYLQNKNRAENQRSYKLYLAHLGEIYKSCADSEDPKCLASYLSRPKAKPEPQKAAPVRGCDPYQDPYQCLYALGYNAYPYVASAKSAAPAPLKTPAYVRAPVVKDTNFGQYYYGAPVAPVAPLAQSFLSPEQKAELLRICGADDVECLQYHFRGAYGYKPAGVPAPSYAHLGSSSQKVQQAPAGLYLRYPNCDPRVDPYCPYAALAQKSDMTAERFCNPLYEENCNPLTGIRYAGASAQSEDPKDDPAPAAASPQEIQSSRYDPYAMFQDAAAASAMRRFPSPARQVPQHHLPPAVEDNSQSLGPPGKTKEGYDCFIGYDEECYPVGSQNVPSLVPQRQVPHAMDDYEPHLNADGTRRRGVIEPDPHCDPDYDRNCHLRRYEPEADEPETYVPQDDDLQHQKPREEPEEQREEVYREQQPDMNNQGYEQQQYDRYMSGQEDPYASYDQPNQGSSNFQDILTAYASRFPNQQRAYGDYKKK